VIKKNLFDVVPHYETKTVLGDFNAQVGKYNGKVMAKFALGRDLADGNMVSM
jgi:hypothetical protein